MKTYPKIGIRPTIDGRQGGIRESLEEKTMSLAKAVKNLIESNAKYKVQFLEYNDGLNEQREWIKGFNGYKMYKWS